MRAGNHSISHKHAQSNVPKCFSELSSAYVCVCVCVCVCVFVWMCSFRGARGWVLVHVLKMSAPDRRRRSGSRSAPASPSRDAPRRRCARSSRRSSRAAPTSGASSGSRRRASSTPPTGRGSSSRPSPVSLALQRRFFYELGRSILSVTARIDLHLARVQLQRT